MQELDQQTLIFGLTTLVGFVVVLAALVFWQQKKIKQLQTPKYGFLGKPLMGLVATIVMMGGLMGGVYLINQDQTTFQTSAGLQINVLIEKRKTANLENNQAMYNFSAIPVIDGKNFGPDDMEFTYAVEWNFIDLTGRNTTAKSEINKSRLNPSKLEVQLRKGTYRLNTLLIIEYNDENGEKVRETTNHAETIVI